jgi:hypothetical protein
MCARVRVRIQMMMASATSSPARPGGLVRAKQGLFDDMLCIMKSGPVNCIELSLRS